MGESVYQSVFAVDYAFGEFDTGLVLVFGWAVAVAVAVLPTAGVCSFGCSSACCGLQSLAKDDLHAAGVFGHLLDLAAGNGVVEEFVEAVG